MMQEPLKWETEPAELIAMLEEVEKQQRMENKLEYFRPMTWQREVIEKTAQYRQPAAFKGNQVGGSGLGALFETIWSTGRYNAIKECYNRTGKGLPYKWNGRVWDRPTRGLILTPGFDQQRGAIQRWLIGQSKTTFGTGTLGDMYPLMPRDAIDFNNIGFSSDKRGCLDFVAVKWGDPNLPDYGKELSWVYFASQNQDHMTKSGETLDWVVIDEALWSEEWLGQLITRLQRNKGTLFLNATVEQKDPNALEAIKRWTVEKPCLPDGTPLTWYRHVHLREAEFLTEEEVQEWIANYPPHERIYRVEGKFYVGTGYVYDEPDEKLAVSRYGGLPDYKHARHIIGLDWGMSDKGALVAVMIYGGYYYVWEAITIHHLHPQKVAELIQGVEREVGMKIPVAWGQDTDNTIPGERNNETSVLNMLLNEGIDCIPVRAHNAFCNDKSNARMSGINHIKRLMWEGKFKIVNDARMTGLWDEKNTYWYNENGHIHKKKNKRYDKLDAMRHAVIMEPYAAEWHSVSKKSDYNVFKTDSWRLLS